MSDIQSEQLISLNEARATMPPRRAGKRPSLSCLYRWTSTGCRGVRLEYVQVGATRFTSREAIRRFFDRLTTHQSASASDDRPPAKRAGGAEAAAKQLVAKGA